ncbi:MAG: tyrosine--tRNA ligase [Planctomycetota bacterium]|nr:tyrosine--tRNA ligase [Planctomycetota bacterium]MDG2144439.1 tyrosine--tRNA ligase [Planctomycetota bacterium]
MNSPKGRQGDLALFTRNAVDLINEEELLALLAEDRPLRVKFGLDPSSADLHVGHMVQLMTLRRLQEAGHQIVLILGDATAMVGDPSGKNKLRPQLSREEVDHNLATYMDQAGLILDIDKTEIRRNSEWFDKMSFLETLKLNSRMTVAQMLERDTFSKRMDAKEPIGIHEFMYPLMQGWDSVKVQADVELGGTDQLFNVLVGRTLQAQEAQKPQVVFTGPLINGLDGRKMSKSYGNAVGLTDESKDMFGKLMSLEDGAMETWFQLLTNLSAEERATVLAGHPREAKARLAEEITCFLHSPEAAKEARAAFDSQFRDKNVPDDIPLLEWPAAGEELPLFLLVAKLGLAGSSNEARRLVAQGAVRLDGEPEKDGKRRFGQGEAELLIQVGKRRFGRVKVSE